ncbi:lysophospholipid acyltransferase family protein [Microvirga flavescens]|uniref:lysophospholipid acyltransferase family protein n=1 Tax=Microvirga flavescens TaxID=2249811 RepID=UPI00315CF7EB
MLFLRSLIFNVAFYANTVLWMVLLIPTFFVPRRIFIRGPQGWARTSLWLFKVIVGTRVDYRGTEKIPHGGLIVAAKHQSLWETFALLTLFDAPIFILKRELMWIPVFGWYLWKAGCVPVNRKGGSAALHQMTARAKKSIAQGHQILIFPEGTRRPAGAEPAYKYGVAHLYHSLGAPCLPVALNSGLYWPRRKFIRRPGTVIVEIMDPIAHGLSRNDFFNLVQERIETASNRLLAEGRRDLGITDATAEAGLSQV